MKKVYAKKAGYQIKRKRHIRRQVTKGIILAIAIIVLIIMCVKKNETATVCYKENSNVDYKVYLKENEFYKNNYAEKDNQYIASLIDYITTDFNYELSIFEKDIKYDCKYRIEAEVNVAEKSTDRSIYNFKEELVPEQTFSQDSNSDVKISEQIDIDYNKYNDIIKKFVSVYELDNAESVLTVNMYIKLNSPTKNFTRDENDEYIVSLEIPLTTKTVAINLNSNLVGCEDELITCEVKKFCWIKVLISFGVLVEIILIIKLIQYIIKSRTPEDIYKLEQNRILSNYGSYIQKVNNILDMEKYEVLFLDNFNDLLEIRDTIQEPILMFEFEEEKKTYFMIPTKTNILYIFELKVNEEK